MADGSASENGNRLSSVVDAARTAAKDNPAVDRLVQEVENYVSAQARRLMMGVGNKAGQATGTTTDTAEGTTDTEEKEKPGRLTAPITGTKKAAGDMSERVKSKLGRDKKKETPSAKTVNIIEDIDIGVPVQVAYDQWTKFPEFDKWAKGVQTVDQEEQTKSKWRVKVAFSTRNWTSTIIDQVPDQRIAWKSEGPKGIVNGVVTFHALGDDLTKVLLALEYSPAGFFEKTGNLWRAQGRRARLDLKLFRRFVMFEQEAEGGWRGEIHDSEVVSDEQEEKEQQNQQDR